MKKIITKTLFKGLLFSFLAGVFSSVILMGIIDSQTSNDRPDGTPRMNCFPGLVYGIAVASHIFLLLGSSLSFLNFYRTIRKNRFFSFITFFGFHLIYISIILSNVTGFSKEDFLILIPWVNIFIWTFYFVKFRKELISINSKNSN